MIECFVMDKLCNMCSMWSPNIYCCWDDVSEELMTSVSRTNDSDVWSRYTTWRVYLASVSRTNDSDMW